MLLGRSEECARIEALVTDAREGRSAALVLRGEPGVGKTTLVEHAVSRAGGLRVLRATGIESECELPYAGLHQLLRPVLLDLLDRLPQSYGHALRCAFGMAHGRVDDRFLISLGVLGLLSEAADPSGLLCVVDDAHWLDRASADALVFTARRIEAEGIALLLAARNDEPPGMLAPGLPELELTGLDAAAAGALLDANAELPLEPLVRERVLAVAHGNPLALQELPRAMSESQRAGRDPLPEPLPAGSGVRRGFLGAVRRLSADAQAMALLVAVEDTGDVATIARAADALGIDATAIDELEAADLIMVRRETVSFRHPLVRSAVHGGATTNERARMHRALADALEDESQRARRAWHRAAAAPGPDADVADELARAAEEARRRGAHAAAARTFERAAVLSVTHTVRAERLLLAAEAAWDAGGVDRVAPLLDRAVAHPLDDRDCATAEMLRAALELERGRAAAAYELFTAGASHMAAHDPARALRGLAGAAEASWWLGRRHLSAEVRQLGEHITTEEGPVSDFVTHLFAGTERLLAFDFPHGVEALRSAVRLAPALPVGYEFAAAYAAIHLGDPVEANTQYARVVARLRSAGNLRELPFALALQSGMECWLGALPAAASHAAESLRLAQETGQTRSAGYAHAMLAMIVGTQGDEAASRAHARAADMSVLGGLALQAGVVRWALGRLELGLGRPEGALTHLDAIQEAGDAPLNALFSTPDLVEAAVLSGRVDDRCNAAYERFAEWERAAGGRWHRGVAERMRGLLAGGPKAIDRFAASSQALGSAYPYDQARTRLVWGEAMRRMRRRIDSREHLRAALAMFEAIGARPWADRARDELRATGEVAARPQRRALDELTPQERQIAVLVSEGATNREIGDELFLSVRTVEYHLHKMFRRLGLASRHALARLVVEETGDTDPAPPPGDPRPTMSVVSGGD